METLAWTLKFVVFPLLPFLSGTFIRYLHADSFEFSLLNPSELGFSMALLMMVTSENTSRISNSVPRNALTTIFQVGLFSFLLLFSCAIFLQINISATQTAVVIALQEKMASGLSILPADVLINNAKYELMLGQLRWITVITSIIIIPLAIFTNTKYDLEKL